MIDRDLFAAATDHRMMDETPLTDRLHDLGLQPVPDDIRAQHLHRMSAVAPERVGGRFGRLAVAAAALVGFVFGSTGLAVAGALPDPAQDVAHDVFGAVNIAVPEGNRGQCVSDIAKGDLPEAEKQAAKDACPPGGRPDGVGSGKSGDAPGQTKVDKHANDPCRGKPPWAGNTDLTDEERADLQAQRQACPPDVEDEPEPGG